MANIGAEFGTVDQDRTAGIRADLTSVPTGTTVSTTIRSLDNKSTRRGTTRVLDQQYLPGLMPSAVFTNQDAVFDEWSDGTSTNSWTISGRRVGGVPFKVTRANRWASQSDVTVDPAFDIAEATDALVNNDYEEVTIDSVAYDQTLAIRFQQSHITRVRVAVDGAPYSTAKVVRVKPGDKLTVRVDLSPYRSTTGTYTKLRMTVPKSAAGRRGEVFVAGGMDLAGEGGDESLECLLIGDCDEDETAGSLNAVISSLTSAPRNDALVAQLNLEPDEEDEDKVSPPAAKASALQPLTVTGQRSIQIAVR